MTDENKKDNMALDKTIVKEAIKEWLDEQFLSLGKWTAKGISAMILAGLLYLAVKGYGWPK